VNAALGAFDDYGDERGLGGGLEPLRDLLVDGIGCGDRARWRYYGRHRQGGRRQECANACFRLGLHGVSRRFVAASIGTTRLAT
jgi:hypothetical protein